jgi:hypothetical protein
MPVPVPAPALLCVSIPVSLPIFISRSFPVLIAMFFSFSFPVSLPGSVAIFVALFPTMTMFIPAAAALLIPILVPVAATTMTTITCGAFSDEKFRVKCRQILKRSKNKKKQEATWRTSNLLCRLIMNTQLCPCLVHSAVCSVVPFATAVGASAS